MLINLKIKVKCSITIKENSNTAFVINSHIKPSINITQVLLKVILVLPRTKKSPYQRHI